VSHYLVSHALVSHYLVSHDLVSHDLVSDDLVSDDLVTGPRESHPIITDSYSCRSQCPLYDIVCKSRCSHLNQVLQLNLSLTLSKKVCRLMMAVPEKMVAVHCYGPGK